MSTSIALRNKRRKSLVSLHGLRYVPFPRLLMKYGKHHPAPIETFPFDTGVDASRLSKYTVFEAPDPVVFCPCGYAILVTDPRGCWNSEGGTNSPLSRIPHPGMPPLHHILWSELFLL